MTHTQLHEPPHVHYICMHAPAPSWHLPLPPAHLHMPMPCSCPHPSLTLPWPLSVHACVPSRMPTPCHVPSSALRLTSALTPCTLFHAVYCLCHPSMAVRPRLCLPSHPHDHLHPSSPAQTPFKHTIFECIYTCRREWHPVAYSMWPCLHWDPLPCMHRAHACSHPDLAI